MSNHYDFSKFEPKAWINAIADEGTKQEMIWWLYETDAERNRLAIRVKELEKAPRAEGVAQDAARLDFSESKRATIYCSESGHWVFVDERAKTRSGELGVGIRGCIDAAMKRSGMNKQP